MKYIDEFRNKKLILKAAGKLREITPLRPINIMEVCGTHTHSFFRFGLHKLLPANIRLISGPGCPVCVSSQDYIDKACCYAKRPDVLIVTFGDMLCIPGSQSSLEKQNAHSGNVLVVYSALESIKIARNNPDKKVIFLAVGFETTIPTVALTIITAKKEGIKNLFFLVSLKTMPAAMEYLLRDKRIKIDGFLCPGHVSSIIGSRPYEFIPRKYKIACCIVGFEPLDLMEGIYLLARQIALGKPTVDNQYLRAVNKGGNIKAQKIISKVFQTTDALWRGLGKIPKSGLKLRTAFSEFDAKAQIPLKNIAYGRNHNTRCRCGDVLKGIINPTQCPLFMKACRPENPVGPCMVSNEGACNAYYKYKKQA